MLVYICLSVYLIFIFLGLGFWMGLKYSVKEIVRERQFSIKNWKLFEMALGWIRNSQNIEKFMLQNRYESVCVYGMSHMGNCLVDMLKKNGIEVICGIDREAEKLYNPYVPIYSVEEDLPVADVVIVTAISDFGHIKSRLQAKFEEQVKIVSLEEILM